MQMNAKKKGKIGKCFIDGIFSSMHKIMQIYDVLGPKFRFYLS